MPDAQTTLPTEADVRFYAWKEYGVPRVVRAVVGERQFKLRSEYNPEAAEVAPNFVVPQERLESSEYAPVLVLADDEFDEVSEIATAADRLWESRPALLDKPDDHPVVKALHEIESGAYTLGNIVRLNKQRMRLLNSLRRQGIVAWPPEEEEEA